jgi:hexokinase
MIKSNICWKSVGMGVVSGVLSLLILNKLRSGKCSKNKRVLCIEIGGTSSRFAIFQVNSAKSKIKQLSELIKQNIETPEDLLSLLKSKSF